MTCSISFVGSHSLTLAMELGGFSAVVHVFSRLLSSPVVKNSDLDFMEES